MGAAVVVGANVVVGASVVAGAIVVDEATDVVVATGTVVEGRATELVVDAATVEAGATVLIGGRVSRPPGAPGAETPGVGSPPHEARASPITEMTPARLTRCTSPACLTDVALSVHIGGTGRTPVRMGGVEQAVPFDAFMRDALYGPNGFYTRPGGGHAGRRGDFLTSPEVGPLFGAVLARWIDAEWDRIGKPHTFTVVDAGAGPGTLARSILAARPRCHDALRYIAVELSAPQRSGHPEGVESTAVMPDTAFDGVIIANELLDNLPFRLAVFDDGWREAFVQVDAGGRATEVLSSPFDPPPAQLLATATIGARVPLIEEAAEFIEASRALVRSGSVLAIDYGVALTAELAHRPWRDWLRTYRGNERGSHYLTDPGTQDITTDVPIDQLPAADSVRTQGQFLQRWGIDELVDEGRRVWQEQAARPGLEAMRMRSRISESEALLDPTGLGRFLVAEWRA